MLPNNKLKEPAYLQRIHEDGYVELYEHLITMRKLTIRNERENAIKSLSLSELAIIVNSTRKAIIQYVENKVYKNSPNVLFLLGITGSGKTTTLLFLDDAIMQLKDMGYVPENIDTDCEIGNSAMDSCTFFPSAKRVNGLTIIDFPGFDDTNGYLVQLGVEFAIKYLIKAYKPKILICSSILEKIDSAHKLSQTLLRVIDDDKENIKDTCMLALTKYSNDVHCINMLTVVGSKSEVNPEIDKLKSEITALMDLKVERLNTQIKEKEKILEDMKARQAPSLEAINFTTIMDLASKIKEKEDKLRSEIGIKKIIRIANFTKIYREKCLEELATLKAIKSVNPVLILHSDHERVLETAFQGLMKNLYSKEKNHAREFKNLTEFADYLRTNSIMQATQDPHISDLLYLPEIDPMYAVNFDVEIAKILMANYIAFIIKLNLPGIKTLLSNPSAATKLKNPFLQALNTLLENLSALENYTKKLCCAGESEAEIDKKWYDLHHGFNIEIENFFIMPKWINVLGFIVADKPEKLFTLTKHYFTYQGKILQHLNVDDVKACAKEINIIYKNVSALNEIEDVCKNKKFNLIALRNKSNLANQDGIAGALPFFQHKTKQSIPAPPVNRNQGIKYN